MILYKEIFVGASAYSGYTSPTMTTLPPTPTGSAVPAANIYQALQGWEPHFHKYRCVGTTGADIIISFDGVNDHARIPAQGAGGIIMPIDFQVSYKSVWARSAAGVTSQIQAQFGTRQ